MAHGLFVGLTTLDCIYQVDHVPQPDEKLVAQDCLLVAGGPATNAAVAFRHLGNQATVLSALGRHSVTSLIQADLAEQGVKIIDLLPNTADPPPLSTILVTAATGDRAVVSRNAVGRQADIASLSPDVLDGIDVVLIDGHQMTVGRQIATWATDRQIPVIIDGGSWKPGFDQVLPLATSAVTAAKFRPPQCRTPEDTLAALAQMGIPEVAMTFGTDPICYQQRRVTRTLPVTSVPVTDSLGAGDFFHGAFCHYRLHQAFPEALAKASIVAGVSCQFFGTRTWLTALSTAIQVS